MSKRELIEELKTALAIFREIFKTTPRLLRSIDDIYEDELITTIEALPMPKEAIDSAMNSIYVIKSVLGSIHFDELKTKLEAASFDLHLEANLYNLAITYAKTKIKDKEIKGFLISILKKCKPIVDCVSEVLANPLTYIEFLAKFRSNDFDDLLG